MFRSIRRAIWGLTGISIGGLALIVFANPVAAVRSMVAPTISVTEVPTSSATESALAPDETEVMFTSGEDTLFGTLLIPAGAKSPMPAALLLSGSGPTDRDGNTPLIPGKIDSQKNFARVLASAGVASLRYDKLASGKTGIGSYATRIDAIGFELYVQEAISGFNLLKSRVEVDPTRIAIL